MYEREQKVYITPAIVLELELETRAGSSLGEVFEELFSEE
jgi:hypothetical protein